MYQLTKHEHDTLHKGIVELLEKYDYKYSNSAIDAIIDEWATNKSELIKAFQTHPNYIDGKFLIAFQNDYVREIDQDAIKAFSNWISRARQSQACKDNLPDEVKRDCEDGNYAPFYVRRFFERTITNFTERNLRECDAGRINADFPTIKARAGEKTSRVINKICTYLNFHKLPNYNREYAKYADALTPLTIVRHSILSVNPIDYLTMSFGNSWSSCHTIDKENKRNMPNTYEGQYSSGTVSYMLDKPSFVFYTVDAKYQGDDYFTQDKINRQMFHYAEDKLIQGRLYPQSNDGNNDSYAKHRALVQEVIAKAFDFPNMWIKRSKSPSVFAYSMGTHYRDYECFDDYCNVSTHDIENETRMTIGHDPICVECGGEHSNSEYINCCHNSSLECYECGCTIDSDDAIWIDGECYCPDCVEWCSCCEEYYPTNYCEHVSGYGHVCESCLDEYFTRCDDCGEWYHNDDIDEVRVNGRYRELCSDCLDDYVVCDDCGDYFDPDEIVETDDNNYCKECCENNHAEEETEDEGSESEAE